MNPRLPETLPRIRDPRMRARAPSERSQRADQGADGPWYWEQDENLRFVHSLNGARLSDGARGDDASGDDAVIGKTLEEMLGTGAIGKAQWQRYRAIVASRGPLRAFDFECRQVDGRVRTLRISGRPMFNEEGVFCGYRGVGLLHDTPHSVDGLLGSHVAPSPRAVAANASTTDGSGGKAGSAAATAAEELPADLTPGFLAPLASAALDALPASVCVVHLDGTVVAVNRAWRKFAAANSGQPEFVSVGANYLQVCESATRLSGPDAGDALAFADGLRRVLAGQVQTFELEYACHSPARERWFLARASRFADSSGVCVVAHEDISGRRRRDEELERFRAAVDATADAIYLVDPARGQIMDLNDAASSMLGYTRDELLVLPLEQVFGASAAQLRRVWAQLIESNGGGDISETQHRCKDGTWVDVEVRRRAVRVGGAWIIVKVARDTSDRKRAEQAIQLHAEQQGLIASFGQFALENPALDDLMKEATAIAGRGLDSPMCRLLAAGGDDRTLTLRAATGWRGEWRDRTTFDAVEETEDRFIIGAREAIVVNDFERETRYPLSSILHAHHVRSAVEVLICGANGPYGMLGAYSEKPGRFGPASANFLKSVAHTLAAAIDRKSSEERLTQMALFDVLTGLPNRVLCLERLWQTLLQAERERAPVAVMFVDLDRFKIVNDTLGHDAGDQLLIQVARRLGEAVRASDTVARLGGDEFALILSRLTRPEHASVVAEKIVAALAAPFQLGADEVYVTTSIGISVYPQHGRDPDTLLKNADVAMYRAKESGRNTFHFYWPESHERSDERLKTETLLRGALERKEFLLHYQPKVDLVDGNISGFEALLRWQHPDRGLVPPGEFVSLLEDTGLIVPVGEWVLRSVCQQIKLWQSEGIAPKPIAINVSARQFRKKDLDVTLDQIRLEYGVAAELLEFELTESILMSDSLATTTALQNMKARGLRLSVDDFGTGHSSLAYLRRFPLDVLKIDRSFIRDIANNAEDATIAAAIIALARNLKLKVVAEGVETDAQLAFLRAHGCHEMQGFYFSRPLPVTEATRALREQWRLGAINSPPKI